ncbi:MAG: FliM/FliN family flagellar motor switch protein [Neptuniibacter sp.]
MNDVVSHVDVPEAVSSQRDGEPLLKDCMSLIKGVKVELEVKVGEAELTVEELMALGQNSVVPLHKKVNSPVDLLLDGKVIARGELVAADENYGIQINEILES